MAAAERKALALECIRFASSIYGSNSEILKEEYGRRKEQRVKHKCKREKKRRAQVVLEGCRLKTSNRLPPSFSQCAGAFASTPGALWYPSRVPFVEYLPCRSTCWMWITLSRTLYPDYSYFSGARYGIFIRFISVIIHHSKLVQFR